MISRRNYIVISVIMFIVFFLFQYSQIIKTTENNYMVNDYEKIEVVDNHSFLEKNISIGESDLKKINATKEMILFVGNDESEIGSIVSQWAYYTKNQLYIAKSIDSLTNNSNIVPKFIIIDSNFIDFNKDTNLIISLTEKGASVVFCNLPDVSIIENNDELRKLLGISYIKSDEVTVEGIKLFSGFLLGGETIYEPQKKSEEKRQDMDLVMPWYVTAGGTKTYMVGIMDKYYDDYKYKNEYFPAIIWRNSLGNAQVFCVCGDYMSQTTGLGILSAMIYELSEYQIYPIVNAQNTLLINYPLLANENNEEFSKIYARNVDKFQKEVIWPTLISLSERYGLRYTSFLSPKYNYSDLSEANDDSYDNYLELLGERSTEIGTSLVYSKGSTLEQKLSYDENFFGNIQNTLKTTSAFMSRDDLEQINYITKQDFTNQVRTIACKEDIFTPILSYLDDDVTLQSLTSDTKHLTYSSDLRLKSIETTLGFDNAELNFGEVIWPESDEDHWQVSYNDMSSALSTYWKPFRVFDRTTLTESDERVRVFLNLSYEQEREQNEIVLHVSGRDDHTCYFILRTHGENITKMAGGSYKKIEKDAYLLTIEDDQVTLGLKSIEKMK